MQLADADALRSEYLDTDEQGAWYIGLVSRLPWAGLDGYERVGRISAHGPGCMTG